MRLETIATALRYAWASPATFVGFAVALTALGLGASARVIHGAVEVGGGRFASVVTLLPRPLRFSAITFGHVIIGASHDALARHRGHEHVHVRQYERWGALFFVLYPASSLLQLARGRDPYSDNHFEREAFVEGRPCA